MNAAEACQLVPLMLDTHYPGRWQRIQLPRDMGDGVDAMWTIEVDDVFCLAQVHPQSIPLVSFRSGLACDIPLSTELACHIACANDDLVVGRLYYERGNSKVVLEETVFVDAVSFQFPPSLQNLTGRFQESLGQAQRMGLAIRENYGGRALSGNDWMLLMAD